MACFRATDAKVRGPDTHGEQGEPERPSRRQIFGEAAAACWRSRGGLSGGKKEERG